MRRSSTNSVKRHIPFTHNVFVMPPSDIGITVEENADNRVEVIKVKSNTEAANKFLIGDCIATINGTAIHTKNNFVAMLQGQQKVDVKVERHVFKEFERKNMSLIRSSFKSATDSIGFMTTCIEKQTPVSGLGLSPVQIYPYGRLISITDVEPTSPFFGKLNAGDYLLAVNGERLRNRRVVNRVFSGPLVVVTYCQLGSSSFNATTTSDKTDFDDDSSASEMSFIDPPTEIKEYMGTEKQKAVVMWRTEHLTDNNDKQAMQANLDKRMRDLQSRVIHGQRPNSPRL